MVTSLSVHLTYQSLKSQFRSHSSWGRTVRAFPWRPLHRSCIVLCLCRLQTPDCRCAEDTPNLKSYDTEVKALLVRSSAHLLANSTSVNSFTVIIGLRHNGKPVRVFFSTISLLLELFCAAPRRTYSENCKRLESSFVHAARVTCEIFATKTLKTITDVCDSSLEIMIVESSPPQFETTDNIKRNQYLKHMLDHQSCTQHYLKFMKVFVSSAYLIDSATCLLCYITHTFLRLYVYHC